MPNEATTTPEDMQRSLASLEALSGGIEKAYGGVKIENSGTVGSEGPKGGGQPGASDIGQTETLMIGKLVDAGAILPTAQLIGFMGDDPSVYGAGRMAGFMTGYEHGKAGKDMDMGDGKGDDYMDGYKKGFLAGHGGDGTFKSESASNETDLFKSGSLYNELRENPETAEALDASAFVESMARGVSDALDQMHKSLREDNANQTRVNHAMIKSQTQLAKAVVEVIAPVVEELGKRLDIIERTPNPQRGATSVSGAKALAKSIPGEAGDGEQKLSKSEVVSTLSYLNLVKGQREIAGQPTSSLVARIESADLIDESTLNHVRQFLAQNPGEADQAKAYH